MSNVNNENIELELLLEAVYRKYGYDFRSYSMASVKRRVQRRMEASNIATISELQHQVLFDQVVFNELLNDLSINVTEMFRDPSFFLALREQILPTLKDIPFVRIWHAGCATGEEVYSMAILLREADLMDRSRVYATDYSEKALRVAREGIYSLEHVRGYTQNYQRAGGARSFADYYTARYGSAIMNSDLRKNIVFADHNLATDKVFTETDIVICRNVLIYFSRKLQNEVFELFSESLADGGYLCLGNKETMAFSGNVNDFEVVNSKEKIYRRKPRKFDQSGS